VETILQRREFIALLGGAAILPLAGRAHSQDGMRRFGVLAAIAANDPEA